MIVEKATAIVTTVLNAAFQIVEYVVNQAVVWRPKQTLEQWICEVEEERRQVCFLPMIWKENNEFDLERVVVLIPSFDSPSQKVGHGLLQVKPFSLGMFDFQRSMNHPDRKKQRNTLRHTGRKRKNLPW